MKLDKHAITWTSGIVLACVAFLSLVTGPQMGRIRTVMAQIDSEQQDLQRAEETDRRVKILEREVMELQEQTAAFNDQIPVGENLGRFLQNLARCAEQRRVQLGEIQPGTPVRSDSVIALPVAFNVRGPFRQVFELIQDVERMPRLTLVEHLDANMDETTPGTVSAQLRLRLYYRPS